MIPEGFIKPLISLLASLALMTGGYFAWQHFVAEPYRAEGRMEMVPALEAATKQLEATAVALKQVEGYMLVIKQNSDKLKRQVEAAQKANAARKTTETVRTEHIDRVVPVGNTECERTADAIKKVLR